MHREHRAQVFERPVGEFVGRGAVIGVVLPVRLGDAHIQIARADAVDIGYGTAGGVCALDAVVLGAAIDQTADCTADLIIHAGLSTGPDGNELLLCYRLV